MSYLELGFAQLTAYSFYLTAALAMLLDFIFGDPESFPHPVVGVGKLIAYLDRRLNRPLLTDQQRLARGVLLSACLPAGLTLCLYGFLKVFYRIHPLCYLAVRLLLAYQLLAIRSLGYEAEQVAVAMREQGIVAARNRLSRIVGRDTEQLTAAEVVKASVETVAENFSDGVVAPLFFFVLFDLPGMFFYKIVNTMDSMLGYRNARYEYFGKFAAKLDDLVNYLPARLSAFFLWLACFFCGLDSKAAWQTYWRDRNKHLSPNSGHPEAVAAGALGLALGGTHNYGGQAVVKETIGQEKRPAEIEDIDRMVKMLNVASLLALAFLLLGRYAWERFIW